MSDAKSVSAGSITVGQGADAREIAYLHRSGKKAAPALVWLGGYRSDMSGTKAVELAALAGRIGTASIRFDCPDMPLSSPKDTGFIQPIS